MAAGDSLGFLNQKAPPWMQREAWINNHPNCSKSIFCRYCKCLDAEGEFPTSCQKNWENHHLSIIIYPILGHYKNLWKLPRGRVCWESLNIADRINIGLCCIYIADKSLVSDSIWTKKSIHKIRTPELQKSHQTYGKSITDHGDLHIAPTCCLIGISSFWREIPKTKEKDRWSW